ncbi:MAG: nitrilase-related carbon-nitrogen hydrolase [Woeseiaceae bacterium]|nr:nitrilase-related carbon-nitrogen hydrolase [Woeseiaceae bacterium]
MARLKCGLIQMSLKGDAVSMGPDEIRDRMIDAHMPYVDDAGKQGVQVLCFQEVFTQPYFCPSQDRKWYAAAERIPDGHTTSLMREQAKKHGMVIVVPIYEEAMPGVYYNTAAVIDADGSYLGKYRKTHIPQVDPGFYEKFFFKPGDLGYPVFETAFVRLGVYICYDRHFPEGWRALALNGAEYIGQPVGNGSRTQQVPVGAGAARLGGGQRRLHRRDQPCRDRGTVGRAHGRVLRLELHREPARHHRGAGERRQGRVACP